MQKHDPKWDEFEPYQEPEEQLPRWLEVSLNIFMPIVIYGLIFCVGGFVLWILPYGGNDLYDNGTFALNETAMMAWSRFITGGLIAAFILFAAMRNRSWHASSGDALIGMGERNPLLLVACLPLLLLFIYVVASHFRAATTPPVHEAKKPVGESVDQPTPQGE